jgi:hypothetical protein
MSKYNFDEDGNIICHVCNGTAYDDDLMHPFTQYVSKEDLRKYGVHFCDHCGVAGKIDWIDHARGVRFDDHRVKRADAVYFHDSITTFVALYSFTEYSPIEEIIDLNDADERNEVREKYFNDLNKEIDEVANPDHAFMLDRELFSTTQDLKYFNPDYIYGLKIDGELCNYLKRSRSAAVASLVLEVIDYYLDGMNVLPTKGMDKVRHVVNELYDNIDTPIDFFILYDFRESLKFATDDVDYFAREMGLNNFDEIENLLEDAEEKTRYVATRKGLEEIGVLLFD